MKTAWPIACLLTAAAALATAAETEVPHTHRPGAIAWTNDHGTGKFKIEWAEDAGGPWNTTWTNFTGIPATSEVFSVKIPSHLRVMWVSPLLCDLSVTPIAVSMPFDGNRVAMRASGGTGSYTWTVVEPALGTINRTSGYSVVYTRLAAGDNAVRVDSGSCWLFVVFTQP